MNGCMSNECDLTRLQSITLSEGTLQGNDERSESNVLIMKSNETTESNVLIMKSMNDDDA